MQQLLFIEMVLKLSAGLALVVAPLSLIRLFGLPRADTGFWPRLLGALLIGLAGALFLEGRVAGAHGLGLAGCVIVNFCTVSIMAAMQVLDAGPTSARGRIAVWTLVALLILLSVLEIANL